MCMSRLASASATEPTDDMQHSTSVCAHANYDKATLDTTHLNWKSHLRRGSGQALIAAEDSKKMEDVQ